MKIPEFVPGKFLAALLGLNERSIRKLATTGILIKQGPGKYAFAQSVHVRHIRCPPPVSFSDILISELRDR